MNQPSGPNSGSGNGNNRRRRRRPSGAGQGQPQQNGQQPKAAQSNQANAPTNSANKPSNRARRGGRNRRGRGGAGGNNPNSNNNAPALQGIELIRSKYLSLVERHVEARRKYYDFFHRADPNQLRKLEREFVDSQQQVLNFEASLNPTDRELLNKDYGGKPEDRAYTTNHEISPEQQPVPTQGDFEDPHVLESQRRADFKDDKEESHGSIEDYKKLKGLI